MMKPNTIFCGNLYPKNDDTYTQKMTKGQRIMYYKPSWIERQLSPPSHQRDYFEAKKEASALFLKKWQEMHKQPQTPTEKQLEEALDAVLSKELDKLMMQIKI